MSSTSEKAEKLNADIYESDFVLINEIQKTRNFLSRKEAMHLLCNAYRGIKSDASEDEAICPENCKSCELFGGLNNKEILCILKIENKHPIFKRHSIAEAQACSVKSTLVTLARKEELTDQITDLKNRVHYLEPKYEKYKVEVQELRPVSERLKRKEKEIEELKKPIETLLTEEANLQTELQDMKNALLERIEQIAVLETDNAQLREHVNELSHDTLSEKYAALTIHFGEKEQIITQLTSEIEKEEALIKDLKQKNSDVTLKISKMVRDFRQFAPSSSESYEVVTYLNNVQKTISDVEGYLKTLAVLG